MSSDASSIDPALDLHRARIASAQRYELVGQLAAPVTHEINNALGVIVMYSDLLRSQFEEGTDTRADLDEIFGAAQRAAWFSKWLNAYAGKNPDRDSGVVSVTRVLKGLEKVATKYAKSQGIEIDFELQPTPAVAGPEVSVEDLVLAVVADMAWSVRSGRIHITVAAEGATVTMSVAGQGELSGIGALDAFTFLAPGPADAGTPGATSTLRQRAERLGGSLERQQSDGRLAYTLRLPLTEPA